MKIAQYIQYLTEEYFCNRSDAIEFAASVAGIPYGMVPLCLNKDIRIDAAEELLYRIKDGEPLAYVINNKNFYGADFYVDSRVLIPRPETEILVEEVLDFAEGKKDLRILDICTGSGCILGTLLANLPGAKGVGLDISQDALDVAGENMKRLNVAERAELICGDALRIEELGLGTFDIITCNPPYLSETEWEDSEKSLKYEPKNALSAGGDDLLFYKKLMDMIPYLCNKSWCGAFLELGLGQHKKLIAEGLCEGWDVTRDYQHIERVVSWTNL